MLTENQVKEEISISYVNAISAICNFGCEITRRDMDSIDATIKSSGLIHPTSTIRSPEIQLQLKATENLTLNLTNTYPFSLPVKNYNDLRGNTMTPRLLVVLHLSNLRHQWVTHSINDLIIKNCAFWLNLKGAADTANRDSVTVYLPNTSLFSPAALTDLMLKASQGVRL